ncbi:MAG: CoA transferase [Actinomycetia bacterium]|nr:CoA transferase [Actinomycetes bacterium]
MNPEHDPQGATGAGPLAGLRVLDLGTRVAAPFCAGLLGEMGADVIKIEQPGTGDFMRGIGPFVDSTEGDYSLFWAVEGRGRRSVALDLRHAEGQAVFRQLARQCDVVVENFRPGTLERWNIGPASLADHLVVVRISAFGQDGPNSQRPGLDRLGIGYGGLLSLTGEPDRPPVRPGVTVSDYLTGSFAAQAATAALYRRDNRRTGTGTGAVVDACLYASVLRILEWTIAAYDRLGTVREREGNRLGTSAPLDNYLCADGRYVCLVAGSDANFTRLCNAMGRSDLLDDPRFTTLADRARHSDEINGIVADWAAQLTGAEVEHRAIEHDVPVATAYSAADIAADEHMADRGDLVSVDDPVAGPVRQQAPATRFVGESRPAPTGAPRLGEHTLEVLTSIAGISNAEVSELLRAGTAQQWGPPDRP